MTEINPYLSSPSEEISYEIDKRMRSSYTIGLEGFKLIVRVIEIFPDHKSYERRFSY